MDNHHKTKDTGRIHWCIGNGKWSLSECLYHIVCLSSNFHNWSNCLKLCFQINQFFISSMSTNDCRRDQKRKGRQKVLLKYFFIVHNQVIKSMNSYGETNQNPLIFVSNRMKNIWIIFFALNSLLIRHSHIKMSNFKKFLNDTRFFFSVWRNNYPIILHKMPS